MIVRIKPSYDQTANQMYATVGSDENIRALKKLLYFINAGFS